MVSIEDSEVQSGVRLERKANIMDAEKGSSSEVRQNKMQPSESGEDGITAEKASTAAGKIE